MWVLQLRVGIETDDNYCDGKSEIVGAEPGLHVEGHLEGNSEKEISIQRAEAE